ncbi:MAG TPA: NAD(P)/FAD-dependent oxidoreductase, partial [Clostridia bacterium]|nr:NAD(P)/FAD-dependent oxidoreductase [Clostridia bacterium]
MRFVIVGAGIAGISAARAIRETTGEKMGKTEIHIFTEEPYPLYYRPKLIDFLAGEATLESLLVYTPDWYRQQGINLHLGTKVTEVDLASGNVISADGENVPFDSLLLATGARPFVPPIPGLDLKPPIFVLRTAEDAKALRKAAEEASSVLVLGGGLLGIEAARSLSKLGLSVHVLEQSAHLLKKQLDEKGAEILRAKLESMGLNFLLGKKCEGIEVRPGKRVEVTLEGGEKHAFDMVLVASGVRSRVELASALGCKVERGVVVDDNLATTVSG